MKPFSMRTNAREQFRKQPPTEKHIEETISLFKQFCLPIPALPRFKHYYDLEKYRTAYILKANRKRA